MTHVVLVHGMAATEHSWFKIPDGLKAEGYKVSARTLPGHVNLLLYLTTSLDDYVDAVVDQLHPTEKTVLIGHSMGGFVISEVAARFPDRIEKLIYVAAMLPRDGDTIAGLMVQSKSALVDIGTEFNAVGISIPHDAIGMQPVGPLNDPFKEGAGFADVPRHYIRCRDDLILKSDFQDIMLGHWPDTSVSTLATGHLPQLSMPDKLLAQLLTALE